MDDFFGKSVKGDSFKGGEHRVPTVLLTGFGPFRNHTENSSWLTVKELLNLNITEYNVIAKELPVDYSVIAETIPRLWKEIRPELTVHCGMSDLVTCLTLEKQASNTNYQGCDIKGNVPPNNECCSGGPETLYTSIDIDQVLQNVNSTHVCVKAEASEDAGRYLCEFIYYTSLKINRNTAFVHIPPVNQPYSASAMAQTLAIIISTMLKQNKTMELCFEMNL